MTNKEKAIKIISEKYNTVDDLLECTLIQNELFHNPFWQNISHDKLVEKAMIKAIEHEIFLLENDHIFNKSKK